MSAAGSAGSVSNPGAVVAALIAAAATVLAAGIGAVAVTVRRDPAAPSITAAYVGELIRRAEVAEAEAAYRRTTRDRDERELERLRVLLLRYRVDPDTGQRLAASGAGHDE